VSWYLLLYVQLEYVTRFLQVEGVSVYDQLVFASVRRYVAYVLNGMAAFSKRLNEKFDIYHARQFTGEASGDCADESLYIRKCAAQVR
jgi:hypothetical protein